MYAVIATGGKQYRVREGDVLKLEKLDAQPGEQITFDQVLMLGEGEQVRIGNPVLESGSVTAEVTEQGRGKKIEIIKFRRRKHHQKRTGHRQYYTEVRVTGINA